MFDRIPGRMRLDARRSLTAAAVLGCSLLAACGNQGANPRAEPYSLPTGTMPVKSPTAADDVLTSPVTAQKVDTPRQPNLLMITMDDAALKDMQFMPHLQHLIADQGITLTKGLSPTPICVPARASLLTGQYADNHGAETISGVNGGFDHFDDRSTLPVALQKAGYDTALVGKYLNGYEGHESYVPPGWNTWRATASTYNYWYPGIITDGKPDEERIYSTTAISDTSNELLADSTHRTKPWYMWVNYVAPHVGSPHEPDDPKLKGPQGKGLGTPARLPRDKNTFKNLNLDTTPEMFEKDTSDKGILKGVRIPTSDARKAALRVVRQQRVESLQAVDRAIARTVRTLRTTGELDSTYIVVTSDNGYYTGEHNLVGKLYYFRDALGVPMFVRGPGLPKGVTSATPVSNADWAPTFAALAGAKMPGVDGVDVLPWLTSGATRRVVPIEAWKVKGGRKPIYTGVSVGPWTYVKGANGRSEMYDARVDPYQVDNLINDPRYRPQRKELRKLTRQYLTCRATSCQGPFMK